MPDAATLTAVRERLAELGTPMREQAGGLVARDPSGIAVLVTTDPEETR